MRQGKCAKILPSSVRFCKCEQHSIVFVLHSLVLRSQRCLSSLPPFPKPVSQECFFSQFKEFSQVEPLSLSLKTKPYDHQTISTRFPSFWARSGLITWGGGQLKLFRNNIFIYIWLFIPTSKKIWRFPVPDSCLGIPLPAIALGLARILGASVSNTLQVHLDMEGHCV